MLVKKYQLGDIQSFSYLMGFRPQDGVIVLASENIADCFRVPWERFVGSSASVFLPPDLIHKCNNVAGHSTIDTQPEYVGHLSCELEECAMYAHTQSELKDVLLLELVPVVFQGNPNSLQQLNQINVAVAKLSQFKSFDAQIELLSIQMKQSADFQHSCVFIEDISHNPTFSLIYESPYVVSQDLSSEEIGMYLYSSFGSSKSLSEDNSRLVEDLFVPDANADVSPVSIKLGERSVQFHGTLNITYGKVLETRLKRYFIARGISAFYRIKMALSPHRILHFCFFHQEPKAIRLYQQEFARTLFAVAQPYLRELSEATLQSSKDIIENVTDLIKSADENSHALPPFEYGYENKISDVQASACDVKSSILVVEDDYLIALDLAKMIQDSGVDVVDIASNEAEAIDLLKSKAYSIVLLDYNLGDEDCKKIIENLNHFESKFVFVTGYDETIINTKSPMCKGIIKKPVIQQQIARLLQHLEVGEV